MAHRAMPMKYLSGSVVQGAADAFKQESVVSGLSGETRKAYRVLEVTLQFPGGVDGDGDSMYVQFTRKSQTAIVNLNDKSLMWSYGFALELVTSGMFVWEAIKRFPLPHDDGDSFLIVEDPFYVAVDSAGTGNANTVYWRLGVEEVAIGENDRLNLLVNSLT